MKDLSIIMDNFYENLFSFAMLLMLVGVFAAPICALIALITAFIQNPTAKRVQKWSLIGLLSCTVGFVVGFGICWGGVFFLQG